MPTSTYEPIETNTLVSAQSSITFGSGGTIPQTYTDLVLVYSAKVSAAADIGMYFNGVTGTSYSSTYLSGNGSTAVSARLSNRGSIELDYNGYPDSTNFNTQICNIMNYSNTTTYKTTISRSSNASTGTDAVVGLYRDTIAITSITLDPIGAATFSAGSTFTLYGIKAA